VERFIDERDSSVWISSVDTKTMNSLPRTGFLTESSVVVVCFLRESVSESSYLVDPASSHMLVSKIKPCMCKYEQIQTVKLRMAHKIIIVCLMVRATRITVVILELIRATNPDFRKGRIY
jgi:hypothetical protein